VKFDGMSYVFLGNFAALQGHAVIWRFTKLLELLDARLKTVPTRVQLGLTTEQALAALQFFTNGLSIGLIVNGAKEEEEVRTWAMTQKIPYPLEVFTLHTRLIPLSQGAPYDV
jgi:hypothetical protein